MNTRAAARTKFGQNVDIMTDKKSNTYVFFFQVFCCSSSLFFFLSFFLLFIAIQLLSHRSNVELL